MIWTVKCRACLFRTSDLMEVHRHISETGHRDFALLEGGVVKVDWMHIEMELKRREPTK
jgi:hypothetical protein